MLQEVQEQIAKEQWKSDFSPVITCFRFTLASPDSSQGNRHSLRLVFFIVLCISQFQAPTSPPGNPREFPQLSARVPGFVPSEFPEGPPGSNLLHNVKVPSCQLMPHEGTFQLQTYVPSLCCSLVTKSV